MAGFDYLVAEVRQEASAKAKSIRDEARKNAKKLVDEAAGQAGRMMDEEKAAAHEEAEARSTEVSAARLKAKQVLSEARDRLVEQALFELKQELESFAKTKEYKNVFQKLAKQAVFAIGKDHELWVAKRDLPLAKSLGYDAKPFGIIGGAIASSRDGLVRVNNSFEALLEEKNDLLRQKAFQELFKK